MKLRADVYAIERDIGLMTTAIRNSQSFPLEIAIGIPGREDFFGPLALKWLESQSRGLASTSDGESFDERFDEISIVRPRGTVTTSTPYGYVRQAIEGFLDTLPGLNGCNFRRLRRLSIEWDDKYFIDVLHKNPFRHPAPILQELSLTCLLGPSPDLVQPFGFHAPNLTRLSSNLRLDGVGMLASDQMVELDISIILNDYRILHSNANSVERLSINEYFSGVEISEPDTIFPRLVELNVRREETPHYFRSFRLPPKAPNLEILRCLNADMDTSIQDLNEILRNTPRLKSLCIWLPRRHTMSDAGDFSRVLQELPLLQEICILYKPDSELLNSFTTSIPDRLG
jgi:hypothetical protein